MKVLNMKGLLFFFEPNQLADLWNDAFLEIKQLSSSRPLVSRQSFGNSNKEQPRVEWLQTCCHIPRHGVLRVKAIHFLSPRRTKELEQIYIRSGSKIWWELDEKLGCNTSTEQMFEVITWWRAIVAGRGDGKEESIKGSNLISRNITGKSPYCVNQKDDHI